MQFLARIFELFLWVVFIIWVIRKLSGWLRKPARPPRVERQPPAPMKTLHRDPFCGTYVAEDISCRLEEGGSTLHFCSEECRMRYLARQNRATRA
jgi:YHS domain-containing protein